MSEWEEIKGNSGLWIPEKKDESVEGEVVEIKKGLYGLQLVIQKADGTKATTPSHKALQSRLTDFQVGDFIKIVYLGVDLPKVKGQQGTRLYSVFRKPAHMGEEEVI